MPNSLSPEAMWSWPHGSPKYVWIGCRNKHAREVFPGMVAELTHCNVCGMPMRELTAKAVERYKAHNRLCFHCQCNNHHLCTGVDCYGCPKVNHTNLKVERMEFDGPQA